MYVCMHNLFIFTYLLFTHTLSTMVQMTHTFVKFCNKKKLFTFTKFQITFVRKKWCSQQTSPKPSRGNNNNNNNNVWTLDSTLAIKPSTQPQSKVNNKMECLARFG